MKEDLVVPRPAKNQNVVIVDPKTAANRAGVTRTRPRLRKVDAKNEYAAEVFDAQLRGVAGALEAILDQLQVMNMHLESMSE